MVLGFLEIFILLGIIVVLFGPAIAKRLKRYNLLLTKRNKRLQKVAAQRRAEELARRQIRNTKIKIAVVSVGCASLVFGGIYLAFWPLPMQVNAYASDTQYEIDADLYGSADPYTSYDTLSIDGYSNISQIRFYNDWIYAAAEGGKIIRIRENGTGLTEIVSTGGEILSFDFDADDNIIFTDAQYDANGGALLKASFDGFAVTVETLLYSAGTLLLACPTSVTIAPDGVIYFLSATTESVVEQGSALQALRTSQAAHSQDGVLLAYDPATATCTYVVGGLCFGAGLALSPDGETIYISTLTDSSIWAVDASARAITLDDEAVERLCILPDVYPAGLSVSEDGTLWVAVLSPEMSWFESLAAKPTWREVLLRLPQGTRDALMQYSGTGMVVALDAEGNLSAQYILDGKNTLNMLTSVCEVGDRLYVAQGGSSETIGYFTL